MKLFFCVLLAGTIFLAVCATTSYAQPVMGIKVGPSLVTNKSRTYQSAYRIGFEAGLFSEFKIDKQFFLLTELLYAMKGCGGNGTLNLQYLCVPVLAGYHIGSSIDLVFGPEICFLLKGDVDFPNMSSINTTSQLREIDIALNIGARYRLAKKWGVECRIGYGLIGIQKPVYHDDIATYETDSKNNPHNIALQAGFFYNIHL